FRQLRVPQSWPVRLGPGRARHSVRAASVLTRSILFHGEEFHKGPRLDDSGRPTGLTDEHKMCVIKFNNDSGILAISSHPRPWLFTPAMSATTKPLPK